MTKRICSEPECERPVKGRGWCNPHYQKYYRSGLIQSELPLTPKHALSQVDKQRRRAVCAVCGPVEIRLRTGGRGAECMVKRREDSGSRRGRQYGLTTEQLDDLMSTRSGMCHVCGEVEATVIDHDHSCCPLGGSCGECVRGALCHRCNLGLGWFADSPERLRLASDYLEQWLAR